MKKNIFFLCVLLLTVAAATAQPLKVNTNKYRINLPDYWKPGNKVWQILTDKLPEICEELKGKEICGDNCNPKYTVEFYMSEPFIHDYYPIHISSDYNADKPSEVWDFVTYYSFQCYLLLFDNKNKLLTKVVITDTGDIWQKKNRATLLSYAPASPARLGSRFMAINSQSSAPSYANPAIPGPQAGQTPYSYINNNKGKLSPEEKDMLAVIDENIRALKE